MIYTCRDWTTAFARSYCLNHNSRASWGGMLEITVQAVVLSNMMQTSSIEQRSWSRTFLAKPAILHPTCHATQKLSDDGPRTIILCRRHFVIRSTLLDSYLLAQKDHLRGSQPVTVPQLGMKIAGPQSRWDEDDGQLCKLFQVNHKTVT